MRILLVAPAKKPHWGEAFWDMNRVCKVVGAKTNSAPLSLLTIAALTPREHDIKVVDENVRPIDFDEPVDMVGITSFTSHAPRAYEIADAFRARGVKVVMGGVHVSMVPDEALEHCDIVVAGEAENTWPALLEDLAEGRAQCVYKETAQPDITDSPAPRWDLVDTRDYLTLTVQTSRGCPNNCNFCSVTALNGRKMRHKSIDNVIDEITMLRRMNPWKTIFITDDNILGVKSYAHKLFDRLKPLGVQWMCQASINRLDDEQILAEMKAAGCGQVFVGFESVSKKSLNYFSKDKVNKPDHYKAVIDKIHAHGIGVYGSFMLGSDGDGPEIYKDTYDFIDECNLAFAMVNIVSPAPGTELFDRLQAEDRIFCKEWNRFDGEHLCFVPSYSEGETLVYERNRLMEKLYSRDRIRKRLHGLWEKGSDARGGGIPTKDRIIGSLMILRTSPRYWGFILRGAWSKSTPSIGAIVMGVSFNEYARKLAKASEKKRLAAMARRVADRPIPRRILAHLGVGSATLSN
ncbi:MAG: B12-binding domain-containing radical SAM protein [Candidatus Aquicultorales bacterium]